MAEDVDPFAETSSGEEQTVPPESFETTGGFKVNPLNGSNPETVIAQDWPKIANPINFNRHFDRP